MNPINATATPGRLSTCGGPACDGSPDPGYTTTVADRHSTASSRLLHAVDQWSSRAWLAVVLSGATGIAAISLVAAGVGGTGLTRFATIVEAVTLAMVFVVQHTQAREQRITQRKLDELLRAHEQVDKRAIHLESGSDDEIEVLADRHHRHRSR